MDDGTPVIRIAAKALILRDRSVLLQACDFNGQEVYLLPGGTQEFGEPLSDTVCWEVLEETGIRVRIGGLLWVREFIARNHGAFGDGDGEHNLACIFRCSVDGDAEPGVGALPDGAQIGVRWVPLRELLTTTMWPETVKQLLIALDQDGATLIPGCLGDCP